MRQTTKAHRACLPPHIPFAKSDYSPKEEEKKKKKEEEDRICQGPNCQSERKERFAQKSVRQRRVKVSRKLFGLNVFTQVVLLVLHKKHIDLCAPKAREILEDLL